MRLEITRRADLATRALVLLTEHHRRMKAAEIAEALGTTTGFVPQVIAPLVDHAWVRSDPGPTGGYAAAIDLGDVSVLDVIEAVDGPTDTGKCVLENRSCNAEGPCALHAPWARARTQLLADLGRTLLSDFAASEAGSPTRPAHRGDQAKEQRHA